MTGSPGRFNPLLAVIAGTFTAIGDAFLNSLIILPLFVAQMTTSYRTIAMVATAAALSWLASQIVLSLVGTANTSQLPWAIGTSAVRAGAIIVLAYASHRGSTNDERLHTFFACYVAYCIAHGLCQGPANEAMARSTAGRLSSVNRARNLFGGLFAIGAGLVAREALGSSGPGFPRNFTLIFIAAAAALSGATYFLARIREPQQTAPSTGSRSSIADFVRPIGNRNFRRFFVVMLVAGLTTAADPFYVVFIRHDYAAPLSMLGTYLAVYAAAAVISGPLWLWYAQRFGNRAVLQSSIVIAIFAPLFSYALPSILDTTVYKDHVTNPRVTYYIYATVFGALGIALRGRLSGAFGYLQDIAPNRDRPAYATASSLVLIATAAAPLIGAKVIERDGFDRLFLVTALVGLVAVLASGLLTETYARVRPVPQAWRLRGVRS